MMCEHRPETAECLGRDAGTEHWNIAFEIGADKILPPSLACPIARRKEAIGKSAAYPKPVNLIIADFKPVERTHFEVADTSGETLSRLAQKIDRCRAEEQEAACPLASTPTGVDQPAQDLEQSRQTMDFVEDDQLVRMSGKIKFGFRQLVAIRIGLEVEVDRGSGFADFNRERGLADLSWADERNSWHFGQPFRQFRRDTAINHPCIYGVLFQFCKVNLHNMLIMANPARED